MQKLIVVVALSIVVSCGLAVHGEDDPSRDKGKPESFWMKKKLDYSQQILAGLTKGDFDLLMQNARSMRALSKIEGRFRRTDQTEYRRQLAVFDSATDDLIHAAEDRKLSGATRAYTQLVESCVNCHAFLRKPGPQ